MHSCKLLISALECVLLYYNPDEEEVLGRKINLEKIAAAEVT